MTNAKSRDSSYYYGSEGGVRARPLASSRSWAGWCSLSDYWMISRAPFSLRTLQRYCVSSYVSIYRQMPCVYFLNYSSAPQQNVI